MTFGPTDPAAPTSVMRLATNTVVQISGNLVANLVSLVTLIAVTRGLGAEGFGVLTTALVYLMLPVILADLGLSTVVLREISANPERTEPTMRAALPLRSIVALLAVSGTVAIGYALPFSAETRNAIAIGSLGSFLALLSQGLLPVLQAQLKMHWAILGIIAGRVAALALTLAALHTGGGIETVMAANVAGLAVTFLLQLGAVARIVSLRPSFDVASWRSLLRGSVVIGLALALAQIYFRVDTLLVAAIRDAAEVGLYGAAVKFIELAELVGAAIGISVFPSLARFVEVDHERAAKLFQRTFDILIAAAIPLSLMMALTATPVVVLLSGEDFREAGDALRLLAPYVLLSFVGGLSWRMLFALGADRALLGLAASVLAFNISFNLVAIPLYGFRGAAVISVLTQVVAVAALITLLCRRYGFLPSLRYGVAVLPAAALMAILLVTLTGPILIRASVAGAAYAGVLILLPGTVRELVLSTTRRARSADRRRG